MRTLILALTVLLFAAPVWATVTITATKDAGNERKVWIGYTSTEGERIRAFALDIQATDGNIIDVNENDYAVGDDNGGYGIFPGSFAAAPIAVNPTTGQVDNWNVAGYSPVAPAGDPDALGGIGTSGVTIEMGSLYDTAAPSQTAGTLCSVTVDDDVTKLCITANAIRGNVVLESAAEAQNLVLPNGVGPNPPCVTWEDDICFPSDGPHALQYADWVAYNKPACWCPVPFSPGYQCKGDADGTTEGALKYRVSLNDLNVIIANWKKRMSANPDPCADIDHKPEGALKYRVSLNDLNVIIANWKKRDSALTANCPLPD